MMTVKFLAMIFLVATVMIDPSVTQQKEQLKFGTQDQATVRSIIESAHDPDLRWPDFHLSRLEAMKFYEATGFNLAWIKDGHPAPQALAVIAILQDADQKGLNAEDCDGPRWAERIAKMRQSPLESEMARFDAALTISVARYVMALHIGRVNPKTIGLEINTRSEKYDLSGFLRRRLVTADNPATVLQEVEPEFAGYQRALEALNRYTKMSK
jgi:L,D-transpeptidase YcbB